MKQVGAFLLTALPVLSLFFAGLSKAEAQSKPQMVFVGRGWAGNSVNTVIFRKNSLVTDRGYQYISYYNDAGYVVVGKRKLSSKTWITKTTEFKGKVSDAHNTISMMADGEGYLHLSWDHHNDPLRYSKSLEPGSLDFSDKKPMTGLLETKLSYPEFLRLPGGDLLFLYRDGGSGQGNLVINRYDLKSHAWRQLQSNLIDGEKQRNAYWQACVDRKGVVHISWVWRESPDVASNHDMCYARSADGGLSWQKSTGEQYALPINAASAEYVCRIPQKSELINQTSMTTDDKGHPFIATYYREPGDSIPQYHMIYNLNNKWLVQNAGFRKTAFSLSGTGTKRIPVSRPQIITWKKKTTCAAIIFRDEERGNKISVAVCNDFDKNLWALFDIANENLGSWEPTYDIQLWNSSKLVHLFVQYTDQKDSEGKSDIPAKPVSVLEWNPVK